MVRLISIVLLAALAASPAASSLCLVGAAPDCCPETRDGRGPITDGASLSARTCDCCLAVDALPYDRSVSISRPLFGTVPIVLRPESPDLPPRVTRSTEPVSTGDSRLSSLRTVVLLV